MTALFGKKKNEDLREQQPDTSTKDSTVEKAGTARHGGEDLSRILLNPRITEKATMGTAGNVYAFDVDPRVTKQQIKHAVKLIYSVDPVKVRIVTIPAKQVRSMRTGIKGVKSGGKKAYVYLKPDESISLM